MENTNPQKSEKQVNELHLKRQLPKKFSEQTNKEIITDYLNRQHQKLHLLISTLTPHCPKTKYERIDRLTYKLNLTYSNS